MPGSHIPTSAPSPTDYYVDVYEFSGGSFALMPESAVADCVFEAADPQVFEWYIENFGPRVVYRKLRPNVNLFVDNS